MSCHTTIFETGPIYHYVSHSRKTEDMWGASFLFSYIMGKTAFAVLEHEKKSCPGAAIDQVVNIPYLKSDKLYNRIAGESSNKIHAGSIPDQLYCIHTDPCLPGTIKNLFIADILFPLFSACYTILQKQAKKESPSFEEIKDRAEMQLEHYFRLFYITAPCPDKDKPGWDTLRKALASLGSVYYFDSCKDTVNTVNKKTHKCSLCGDFRGVIVLSQTRRGKRDEELCAVCVIKRGVRRYFEEAGFIDDSGFNSTTMLATKRVMEVLADNYDTVKEEIDSFVTHFLTKSRGKSEEEEKNPALAGGPIEEEWNPDQLEKLKKHQKTKECVKYLPYEFYFTHHEPHTPGAVLKQKLQKLWKDRKTKPLWIFHGYYALVSLDGDNTGTLLKKQENKKQDISAALAEYSGNAKSILGDKGQLIYSGGEDTLFFAHPSYIPGLLSDFQDKFSRSLSSFKTDDFPCTISAGVYICGHKHPLQLALSGAETMLSRAKQTPRKATAKIQVAMSTGQRNICTLSFVRDNDHYSLEEFDELVKAYTEKQIPRGFLYKLEQDYDVFASLLTRQTIHRYVEDLYNKTKDDTLPEYDKHLRLLVKKSSFVPETGTKTIDYQFLIQRLSFARFLTQEE